VDRWRGDAGEAVREYQRQASRRSELDRQDAGREKTGVWLGVTAVNPVNGRELPVFIADYVLTGYGTGAIMAGAGEDTRDWDFAETFGLPVRPHGAAPADWDGGAWTGAGAMINSANDEVSLDGLGQGDRDRDDHRTGWSSTPRRGDDHLQAARLAVQPAALLG
jgi:leucyl-tRNA synthetase